MADYTQLQSSITDYAKDTQVDSSRAREFIAQAEQMMERDMLGDDYGAGVPKQMLARIEDTTDAANKITLPTDYITARSVRVNSQRARYASSELVNPEDDGYASAAIVLDYYQRIPVLSDTNTSNWLLDVGYDAYLWGSLIQYAGWGRSGEGVQIWQSYYGNAMKSLKRSYRPQPRGNLYRHTSKYYQSFYTVIGSDMVFGRAQQ